VVGYASVGFPLGLLSRLLLRSRAHWDCLAAPGAAALPKLLVAGTEDQFTSLATYSAAVQEFRSRCGAAPGAAAAQQQQQGRTQRQRQRAALEGAGGGAVGQRGEQEAESALEQQQSQQQQQQQQWQGMDVKVIDGGPLCSFRRHSAHPLGWVLLCAGTSQQHSPHCNLPPSACAQAPTTSLWAGPGRWARWWCSG
jgi:hypothetical protein